MKPMKPVYLSAPLRLLALLLVLLLTGLAVGCGHQEPGPGGTDASAGTSMTDTPGSPGENEEPDMSYEDMVRELKPVLAWNMEPQGNDNSLADTVAGSPAVLREADFAGGAQGQALQTYSSRRSYLELGTGTVGTAINGSGAVSVSMWLMPYVNLHTEYVLFSARMDGRGTAGLEILYKNSSIVVNVRSSAGEAMTSREFSYSLYDGTVRSLAHTTNEGRWQHLAVVVDFAADRILLYLNGRSYTASGAVSFGSDVFVMGAPSTPDTLGGSALSGRLSYNGLSDNLMIFNRALTRDEVETLASVDPEALSPVDDEFLIRDLIARMGRGAAYYAGSSKWIHDGMFNPLDSTDYSAAALSEDGCFYLPQVAADAYFAVLPDGQTALERDGVRYYPLDALCAANGSELFLLDDLAAVMPQGYGFDGVSDALYIERLVRFFTASDIPEPSRGYEQTRTLIATTGDYGGEVGLVQSPTVYTAGDRIFSAMVVSGTTYFYQSTDGGAHFELLSRIPTFGLPSVFEAGGAMYMIGNHAETGSWDRIVVVKSTDGGRTWTDPSDGMLPSAGDGTLVSGASSPALVHNGFVYRAFEDRTDSWSVDRAYIVSAPVDANLLNPDSWTVSSKLPFSKNQFVNDPNGTDIARTVYVEEGCAILGADGCIYDMLRVNCQPSGDYAILLRLSEDRQTLSWATDSGSYIIRFPGGSTKFTVRYDEESRLYYALVNNVTQDEFCWQRNVLSLSVSSDLVHWQVVETILVDRTLMNEYVSMTRHGFQYVDWCFDGDDILLTVRESMGDSVHFHDANCFTFYRIENFRDLVGQLPI